MFIYGGPSSGYGSSHSLLTSQSECVGDNYRNHKSRIIFVAWCKAVHPYMAAYERI